MILEFPEPRANPMPERVTRFNTTQNVIKVSDFRSNDSVLQHLKEQPTPMRWMMTCNRQRHSKFDRGFSELLAPVQFAAPQASNGKAAFRRPIGK